jgi:hypothetical protein
MTEQRDICHSWRAVDFRPVDSQPHGYVSLLEHHHAGILNLAIKLSSPLAVRTRAQPLTVFECMPKTDYAQHRVRLTHRINCLSSGRSCLRLKHLPFLSLTVSMFHIHSFTLLLAALSLGVSASVVSTSLDIVNKQLAPDGYSRL